jgi:hypothetical protein
LEILVGRRSERKERVGNMLCRIYTLTVNVARKAMNSKSKAMFDLIFATLNNPNSIEINYKDEDCLFSEEIQDLLKYTKALYFELTGENYD